MKRTILTAWLSAWLSSLRPQTLFLSLSTILVGNALAYWQHNFHWPILIFTALTAVLLQILSNLANDYGDIIKGTDQNRIGPKRGIHQKLITLNQLRIGLIINIVLCICSGLILLWLACEQLQEFIFFILLGGLAIIAAITYTVGKKAYGYYGLGDIAVLIFFGFISVIGSYYLQTKQLQLLLIYPSLLCGFLSVAILNINNMRDYINDIQSHKITFAIILGQNNSRYYQSILLTLAYLLFILFNLYYLDSIWAWLFLLITPLYSKQIYAMLVIHAQVNIGQQLSPTIKLALLTNLLLVITIILN